MKMGRNEVNRTNRGSKRETEERKESARECQIIVRVMAGAVACAMQQRE
jgi:hypothetical protein